MILFDFIESARPLRRYRPGVETGLPLTRLELEIRETLMLNDSERGCNEVQGRLAWSDSSAC